MDKENLVVIGAGEFQLPLVQKAKALGYEVHCFAWEAGAVAKDDADYFYPMSITDKEEILKKCREIKPSGVLTAGSDLAMPTVAYICEALNLCCNPYEVALKCTDKYEMRKALADKGVPVPYFKLVTSYDDIEADSIPYPVIVKPTDRSGSRGITLVNSKEELKAAVNNATSQSFKKTAIIEGYIDGNEYSCECISFEGSHHFLTFTKKFTTGTPNYIETGHVQPSDIRPEYQQNIKENIFKALDALNIQNGASHTEFKMDENGNIGIIEIGARMGGDCIGSDLVRISTGYDFLKMVINVACGNPPNFTKVSVPTKAEIKFIFTQEDINELEEYKRKNIEKIFRISELELENIGNTFDSSTRVGYYIITPEVNKKR